MYSMCIPCHSGSILILLPISWCPICSYTKAQIQRFTQRATLYSLVGIKTCCGQPWGGSGREGGVSYSKLVFPLIRHVNPETSKSKESKHLMLFKQCLIPAETYHCSHLSISWSGRSLCTQPSKSFGKKWEGETEAVHGAGCSLWWKLFCPNGQRQGWTFSECIRHTGTSLCI